MHCPENSSTENFLDRASACFEQGIPFCVYRKPGEQQITGIYQNDDSLNTVVTFKEKGFVFASFDLDKEPILIQPHHVETALLKTTRSNTKSAAHMSASGRQEHIDLVRKGIAAIKDGRLEKVVLSRKMEVEMDVDALEIFRNLLDNYPQAFCYLFHHPKVGTWCGATPETLVQISNEHFKTMSLAATLPYTENQPPQWGDKEFEEQQMVTDYIKESMSPLTTQMNFGTPESVRAGHLWHLKTEVEGILTPNTKLGQVIRKLHPTPAVCGIPVLEAKNFILEHEDYDRGFYTGFLGELNLNSGKEVSLYVNLRCMELNNNGVSIYVGGGITSSSDPESEWIETQNKSQTMLRML